MFPITPEVNAMVKVDPDPDKVTTRGVGKADLP